MSEKTASQINVEEMERRRAFLLLSDHPHLQAEKIANHYLAHAEIAKTILKLVELRDMDNETLHDATKYLVGEIKRNHAHDFGIALEWPKL